MKLIKELRKENYTLKHYVLDDYGILSDFIDIIRENNDGTYTSTPIIPPFKVSVPKANLLDATQEYSDSDYEEMLIAEMKSGRM